MKKLALIMLIGTLVLLILGISFTIYGSLEFQKSLNNWGNSEDSSGTSNKMTDSIIWMTLGYTLIGIGFVLIIITFIVNKYSDERTKEKERLKRIEKIHQEGKKKDVPQREVELKRIICPNCGVKLEKKMNFCKFCGEKIDIK